ncbi:NAD(+)/NADH kinase [Methylogaea oryzae]|uniref:NAD kinase n=1 Tax=Methylogaea oryzae TaxID=1295382 RepID=A0A8D4VLT5_9GAMM|nr:NAD(+)/NADH kinase [Methylogaea oryzae]BBL70203.1 NAD kinase [Methylogaea oryzae]
MDQSFSGGAPRVRAAALIGKPQHERVPSMLADLHRLLRRRGCQVLLEQGCRDLLSGVETLPMEELAARCDLAIVVGGDGTFLATATAMATHDVPLIGVNLGRVGFLVDIGAEEALAKIEEILDGRYEAEPRTQLRATLLRDGRALHEHSALNEVVVHRWVSASMIELCTTIDGVFLNTQRCDGLIVATPTGSTAYALSGGGPILHPRLAAMALVPINPYTLTNRPIVLDDASQLEITFSGGKEVNAQLSFDTVAINDVRLGDCIRIRKDPKPVTILHPMGYDFSQILRAKLGWSSG